MAGAAAGCFPLSMSLSSLAAGAGFCAAAAGFCAAAAGFCAAGAGFWARATLDKSMVPRKAVDRIERDMVTPEVGKQWAVAQENLAQAEDDGAFPGLCECRAWHPSLVSRPPSYLPPDALSRSKQTSGPRWESKIWPSAKGTLVPATAAMYTRFERLYTGRSRLVHVGRDGADVRVDVRGTSALAPGPPRAVPLERYQAAKQGTAKRTIGPLPVELEHLAPTLEIERHESALLKPETESGGRAVREAVRV